MNTPTDQQCQELHQIYQQMTGYAVSFIGRHFVWADFLRRGLDKEDLKRWLNDLKYRISKGQLDHRSLYFTNAISNLDRCEEGCIELRRRMRGRTPDTERESVLRSAGRPTTINSDSTKSVQDIVLKVVSDPIAAEMAFKEMQALRRSL